jgi:hypothetical protein
MKPPRVFDDGERWVVESALKERYGRIVATEPAEVELRLDPGEDTLTSCPVLYWEQRGAAFIVAKVAEGRYRSLFYYPAEFDGEQYGSGRADYDDLAECTLAVLRAQADHEKQRRGVASGDTADDLREPDEAQ